MVRVNMRPLVVMALAAESNGLIEKSGLEVIYTGVGKVNAAYALMQAIAKREGSIPLVINMGSAGSRIFKAGQVVAARQFVQRDMDATGLGFRHGETPFDPHPHVIEFKSVFSHLQHGVCGTGDSFLQGPPPVECDIIDMEAYALAKVCYLKSIPFAAVKYITDGADGTAHSDWQKNLDEASKRLAELLRAFVKDAA